MSVIDRINSLWRLVDNYVIKRATSGVSTSSFWYLPEPPNLHRGDSPQILGEGLVSPLHVIDYTGKVKYDYKNEEGIIILPYGGKVGDQINPLAAFQYALGHHDCFVKQGHEGSKAEFLKYADYFAEKQGDRGEFFYAFDWYEIKAPWTSALAQSKGASVMLRAWLLTENQGYKEAALKALELYSVPIEEGGYLAVFQPEASPYYEEYPQAPYAALNGFMASLFGPWEVQRYLGDDRAGELFERGFESLEVMLPYFTTSWWVLYDLDPSSPVPNVHSSRYQKMVIGYMDVFSSITDSQVIDEYLVDWTKKYTLINRSRANVIKAYRKVAYR